MALHDNIKRLRKQKGWSQTELAEQIGSHPSHVNRIETGKYKPSVDVLVKLADVFDVSLDALFRVIDSMLIKQKILKLVSQEDHLPAHLAG